MKYLKYLPFYLISIFPLPFLYIVSDIAFFVVYYLFKYRQKVVRVNLENSFQDKTLAEIIEIEKKFYKHFCDIAFESIKVLTISEKSISSRFQVKNIDIVEQMYKQKKDVILYTAHYGNWEWLSFLPLSSPIFSSYRTITFYQQLSNKYFDGLINLARSRYGAICVESNKGYKTLIKLKQENILSFNCIIGDQSPRMDAAKHWTKFLNQDTAFLIGADRIAKKMNTAVIFPSFQKLKRGKYEVEFILLELNAKQSTDQEIIDKYARVLEDSINRSPELWLWSHRRWKLSKHKNTNNKKT